MTRDLDFEEVKACIAHVGRLFLVTDFDGTLAPIEQSPDLVKTSASVKSLLSRLSASPKVVLAILSGRRLVDVRERVGVPAIYGGNHGLELTGPGVDYIHPDVQAFKSQLERSCEELQEVVYPWPNAWIENKNLTVTIHFRQVPKTDWPALIAAIRAHMGRLQETFELRSAHAALEILPRIGWDKGAALKYLRQKLELQHALTICLGDDTTDESMFRAVSDGITIRVGPSEHTHAAFRLPGGVDDVATFLTRLLETIQTTPQPSAVWRPRRGGLCRGAAR